MGSVRFDGVSLCVCCDGEVTLAEEGRPGELMFGVLPGPDIARHWKCCLHCARSFDIVYDSDMHMETESHRPYEESSPKSRLAR